MKWFDSASQNSRQLGGSSTNVVVIDLRCWGYLDAIVFSALTFVKTRRFFG